MVCGDHSEFGNMIDLESTCNPGMCAQVPDKISVSDAYCKATNDPCPAGAEQICAGEMLAECQPNHDARYVKDCPRWAKSAFDANDGHCVQDSSGKAQCVYTLPP
jgi:hypothetical protein